MIALDEIKELVISALLNDESHHKQWYLEQILEYLEDDIPELKRELLLTGYSWEPGIAP